jgi:hypothetical protein
MKQPPRLAAWLLPRFGINESIVGDLIERYETKPSSAWFWRQTLTAIFAGAARDIRGHKLLALRAVVTGFAAVIVFDYLTRTWLNSFNGALWINGHWVQVRPGYAWVSFGGSVSGWIVGRLHRPHSASMTLVFAGSFLLSQLYWCVVLSNFSNADFSVFTLTFVVSILLGGLWGARSANHHRQLT